MPDGCGGPAELWRVPLVVESPVMEPATTTKVAKAASEVADVLKKESESFLAATLGEPAKAFGGLLADRINARRHTNLINICVAAKRKLANARVSPREVPLKIIHPMIEAASLEDKVSLQDVWANLLANAADARQGDSVLPSFTDILKDLTAREVKFLESLVGNALQRMEGRVHAAVAEVEFSRSDLKRVYCDTGLARAEKPIEEVTSDEEYWEHRSEYIADDNDCELAIQIVLRNRLLTERYDARLKAKYTDGRLGRDVPPGAPVGDTVTYSFTYLGVAFLRACRDPSQPPLLAHKGCFESAG